MTPMDSKSKDTHGLTKFKINMVPPNEAIKEAELSSNFNYVSGDSSLLSRQQKKRKGHDDKKKITMDDV